MRTVELNGTARVASCPCCKADKVGDDLLPVRVVTDAQIWNVAELRNACREGFSHDHEPILSREQQFAWWEAQGTDLRAWLFHDQVFCARCHGTGILQASKGGPAWLAIAGPLTCPRCHGTARRPVGFGVLRPHDEDGLVATCGVDPPARGHHYGRTIMRYLVHMAASFTRGPLRSTARKTNTAALKLHDPEHWVRTHADEHGLSAYQARVRFLSAAATPTKGDDEP